MKEIARQLNVSIATVSRALSGKADSVSEETRKAVFELAERSGYMKRKAAGRTVAFLIDKRSFDLSSQFYAGILSGIEEELSGSRYFFQFSSADRDRFDLAGIHLDFDGLAGVIMVGVYHDDFVLKLRRLGVPMVLVDYHIPTEDIPAVLIDNADGILKACRHLSSLGHRRVAYLSGDPVETSAHERMFGFRRAVAEYGLDGDPALVVEGLAGRVDEGFRAMTALLAAARPTAVVAYNDLIAAGAMDAAKQEGLSVPGDVSVMGFDDIRLAAELHPPLSTIHVPKKTMGRTAARLLRNVIEGKEVEAPGKVLVPTSLVVRGSTDAPAR